MGICKSSLYSPLTGKKLTPYTPSTDTQIDTALTKAEECQLLLNQTSLKQRLLWIDSLKHVLLNNKDILINTIHNEIGKPLSDCAYELNDIIDSIEIFKQNFTSCTCLLKHIIPHSPIPDTELSFVYKRKGLVGIITPWNFPFWMPMTMIIPSLLSGCSVILKPSEYSHKTGLLIQKFIELTDFPKNSVQVVIGAGRVGEYIVKDERIQHIFFVGSTNTGKTVAQSRIRSKSKGFTLEMGGNSAAIVTDKALLDNAIPAIFWNATYFAGQICTGIKRVIIHDSVFTKVRDTFIKSAQKINASTNIVTDIGPIISKDFLNTIEYRVACAVNKGNHLYTGGVRINNKNLPKKYHNGNFFPITVMEINNRNIDLIQTETFAPIIPLIRYRDEQEAIEIANETEYDLSANIFSEIKNK